MIKPNENCRNAFPYEIQPLTHVKVNQPLEIKARTWFEILTIITGSLLGLNTGLLMSWPSPFLVKIVNDKEHYDISEEEASYFSVISTVPVLVLPLLWIPIVTRLGRKKLLLFATVPYIVTFLIKAFARNVWVFYLARVFNGIGDSVNFTCLFIYVGEIASPEVRGTWGNALVWAGFLGQFLMNVLGIYCSVMTTSFICVTVPILFLIIFVFMPESPYFYIAKGKDEDAKVSLRRLRRTSNVEEEFKGLKAFVVQQLAESGSWKDLITIRTNRIALFISLFLRVSQIFSGIFTLGAFIQYIFQKTGSNISPETSTIIYTLLNFILYSSAAYGSNKLGRRISLISSLIFTGAIFLSEAAYFFIERYYPDINLESVQWFPLTGLLAFLVFSSYGVGTIPFLMPAELLSTSIKPKGIAIVISVFGLSNFIVNTIFFNLNLAVGLGGPFLMFGICNCVSALVAYKVVPETKNKTLEEIQEILNKI